MWHWHFLISPRGAHFDFSLLISDTLTNNQAKYKAVFKGVKLLRKKIKVDAVKIFGDSMLVVNQLIGKYDCNNNILRVYHEECLELLKELKMVSIEHVPKIKNEEANRLAQSASGYRPICVAAALELPIGDWRREIIEYLKNPSQKVSRQLRYKASKFVSLEGDLYYRTIDGVFLKCLGVEESKVLMGEIHEGVCGEHQLAYKMKWILLSNNTGRLF